MDFPNVLGRSKEGTVQLGAREASVELIKLPYSKRHVATLNYRSEQLAQNVSQLKAVVSLSPPSGVVFLLRHLEDAAHTGNRHCEDQPVGAVTIADAQASGGCLKRVRSVHVPGGGSR